jgi:peroxiredoxin (alkyl hydroperoxide reductase subunit C)
MFRRSLLVLAIAFAAIVMLMRPPYSAQLRAESKPVPPPTLKVGEVAPDFTMKYFDGAKVQDVSLHDYKGKKNVVLAFYIFAFTPG